MNWFRSIRKLLFLWVAVIFIVMLGLLYVGVDGLYSYGILLGDLEFSVNGAPRRSDLVYSIDKMIEPLLLPPPEGEEKLKNFSLKQAELLEKAYEEAARDFADFRARFDKMPQKSEWIGARPVIDRLFYQINDALLKLPQHLPKLKVSKTRDRTCEILREQILVLQMMAMRMPDPAQFLLPKLEDAQKQYRARLRQFIIVLIVALMIMGAFTVYVFFHVLVPIKTLRLGAQRILNGDPDHQVDIPQTNELGQLARIFNQSNKFFRDQQQLLETKVQERTRELNISGRLASVGFLAAGVAHEINNPILAINVAAESLEYRLAPALDALDDEDRTVVMEYLHLIQQESTRCQGITERLLEFSRGSQSVEKQPVDIVYLVREVVGMIQHLHKYHDRKISVHHTTNPQIEAIASEIKQVILNLVSNALEAVDQGGEVEIEVLEQQRNVQLIVRDNGCGMTKEVLDHLFDPFFTQRRDGKGTGLGLSISKRIIKDHNGSIEPASEGPGTGSSFRICLPYKQPAIKSQPSAA